MRSQGRVQGHGLVFNSRISPSPNRSLHRRRRRHRSKLNESGASATESESEDYSQQSASVEFQVPAKKISRRNLTNEIKSQSVDHKDKMAQLDKSGKDQVDRSEKSEKKRSRHRMQEMDVSGHHSVTSKYSSTVSKEGKRTHRVRKFETETVNRQVSVRTREQVISRTSDYSSQSASDTEKDIVTSTPKDTLQIPAKVESRRDSPRLQAFEGDDWIHSPRTGYTYASSLTYRDKVTPGREVPMPHMTRLPLEGYEGLAHTELWEQSEIEVRKRRMQTLAEYSEDEGSPPHRIYRRRGATEGTTTTKSNYLTKLYLLFLPLTITYSATRYLLRTLVYDIPAHTHNIDINLLMKSEHSRESNSRRGIRSLGRIITTISHSLFSSLLLIISLPVSAVSAARQYLVVTSEQAKEPDSTPTKTNEPDLISEDEDESGLSEFVSAQKHIYSFKEHLEDQEKNTDVEKYESFLMKSSYFFNYLSSLLLAPGYLISGLWDDFLDNISETSSEKSDSNYQELIDQDPQGECRAVQRKSIFRKTIRYLRHIMFSLVDSIGPSVSGNYLITENIKSPKRVIFKDLPEMPDSGAVSPIIVEEVCNERLNKVPHDPDNIVHVKHYHIVPEKEELQLNSYYEENTSDNNEKKTSAESDKSFSLSGILLLPFYMLNSSITHLGLFLTSIWVKLFYSEPELRRSRRLRGLNPEQLALQEKERKRRMNLMKGESSVMSNQEDDTLENSEVASESPEQTVRKKLSKKMANKRRSFFEWFVSLFYRKKEVRRSRRLRGLGPEQVEMIEKRRRLQRKQVAGIDEDSSNEEILNEEVGICDKDQDEESEFILSAYFYSFSEYFSRLLSSGTQIRELDEFEKPIEKNTKGSVSEDIAEEQNKNEDGILKQCQNFIYSLFFTRQTRRSRRLRGLEPEYDGKLKTNGVPQNIKEEKDLEEYDEFRLLTWLKSCYRFMFFVNLEDSAPNSQPTSVDVVVNEATKSKKQQANDGLYHTIIKFVHSLFFKKKMRQSRRLRGLRPENGGFIEKQQKRNLRSRGAIEDDVDQSFDVEDDENDEEYYEFIFFTWLKLFFSGITTFFSNTAEADLSVQNIRKHNRSQSGLKNVSDKSESSYSVVRWLKDQYGNMAYENEVQMNGQEASTMADLSFEEEEALKAKENADLNSKDLTAKSKNIFSFMFLGFLPSWNTSWWWNSKSSKRSRRLIGKDPVEEDCFDTWKAKTLEDDESTELGAACREGEDSDKRAGFPLCCYILLIIPLVLGLLVLLCYLHPSSCPQSLSHVPDTTKHLITAIKNTTNYALLFAGDQGSHIASYARYSTQKSMESFTSNISYLMSGLSTGAGDILTKTVSASKGFLDKLVTVLLNVLNSISSIPSFMWSQIMSIGENCSLPVSLQTSDISSIPSTLLSTTSTMLSSAVVYCVDSVSSAGLHCINIVRLATTGLGESAVDLTLNTWTVIASAAQNITSSVGTGLTSAFGAAADGFQTLGVAAISGLSGILDYVKSGTGQTTSSASLMFADLATWDFFYPLQWLWASISGCSQSVFDHVSNIVGYVATSVSHLAGAASSSIVSGAGNIVTFVKEGVMSGIGGIGSVGKESSYYLTSLPYKAVTGLAGLGAESVSSLVSGFSFFLFNCGYLVTSAWEKTNSYFRPKQQTSAQEAAINYELLIEKVLNSDKFLRAVSEIANTKVDTESERFKEQLSILMNEDKIAREKESVIIEQYKSRIDGIKVEVSNEIKKLTEDFIKENLKDSESKATIQDQNILILKEKYQQMLLEAELTKSGITTHTEATEKLNQELQNQIEDLKKKINVLEDEQKSLNLTMVGCCKNISAIEITVEHYINDLFSNIMENKAGDEGKPAENFAAWVNTYFLAKTEIETKMTELSADIDKKVKQQMNTELRDLARYEAQQTAQQIMDTVSTNIRSEYAQRLKEAQANNTDLPTGGLSKDEVFKIVKNALIQYDADKTGMFDYALETAGGSVVSTRCTETYMQKTAMYSIFGIPIWYPSNNPRTIIQPGVQPGECWAFKGSSGFVVIQLSERIKPTRFSMEHISKSMSPSGKIDSAPKDFVVYGLRHEKDTDPVKLGEYSYSQEQDPLQFYEVKYPSKEGFPYIELDIISNHGNLNYTCLYRFRVHGVQP